MKLLPKAGPDRLARFGSAAREMIFAVATILVSFNLFPESMLVDVVAGTSGLVVLIWGICNKATDKAALGSFLRKAAVGLSGVAVRLDYITSDQAGGIVTVIVMLAAMRFGSLAATKNEVAKELAKPLGPYSPKY
jgi:hypothetical protein